MRQASDGTSGRATDGEATEAAWRSLCEAVRDCADGFAATDPRRASIYRRDAERFSVTDAPPDDDGLTDRYADAADLRERWGVLFVGGLGRKAR